MWILLVVLFGVSVAEDTEPVSNERTLHVRSLPGYPGVRSDLYEVHLEPYYFPIDITAVAEVKALNDEGMPVDGPRGIMTLQQMPNGVRISGSVSGLSPGKHGFHVHEKGDLRKGCTSAGAHFNPYLSVHGSPHDPLRHVGDLGNIEASADGVANVEIIDHYLTFSGVRGVIGRALVVHEKPDDLGRAGTEDSLTTGSAGARLACGVISYA